MKSFRLIMAAALAFALSSSAGAQTLPKVHILAIATDSGAQGFYAQEQGFFKRAGLDATIEIFNSAAISPAIASGAADIGTTSLVALVAAVDHGAPFVMVAPASIYSSKRPPTDGIVVAKSSTIHGPRDFAGKTVAVSGLQNIGQLSVEAWIDKGGGDSKSVKFIEMPSTAMSGALKSGRIDAMELAEPLLDDAIAHGGRTLGTGYTAIANEFAIAVWFCTKTFAAEHPDVVRRFANAMTEAARWGNTHHTVSAKIVEKYSKVVVDPSMPRVVYGEGLNVSQVQPVIDTSAKYKAIRAPFPATDLFAFGPGK